MKNISKITLSYVRSNCDRNVIETKCYFHSLTITIPIPLRAVMLFSRPFDAYIFLTKITRKNWSIITWTSFRVAINFWHTIPTANFLLTYDYSNLQHKQQQIKTWLVFLTEIVQEFVNETFRQLTLLLYVDEKKKTIRSDHRLTRSTDFSRPHEFLSAES